MPVSNNPVTSTAGTHLNLRNYDINDAYKTVLCLYIKIYTLQIALISLSIFKFVTICYSMLPS